MLLRRLLPLALLLPLLFAVGSVQALRLGLLPGPRRARGVRHAFHRDLGVGRVPRGGRGPPGRGRAPRGGRAQARPGAAQPAARGTRPRRRPRCSASEEHTRELLDILSHTPVIARGLDGRIRFWSAGAERLYGWSSEEATRRAARDLLADRASRSRSARPRPPCSSTASGWARSTRRTRDGAHAPDRDPLDPAPRSRRPAGRHDRGRRRRHRAARARRALVRGSEARYRALVAATAQIVWTTSADGRERRRPDASGRPSPDRRPTRPAAAAGSARCHPEDQPEAARVWNDGGARAQGAGDASTGSADTTAQYRHMEVRAVPVLDEQGTVREWVGAHADVTDRVKAEEQLAPGAEAPGGGHARGRRRPRGEQPAHGGARLRRLRASRSSGPAIRRPTTSRR